MLGLITRELRALWRNPADIYNPVGFMFLAVLLFVVASPSPPAAAGLPQGASMQPAYGVAMLWLIVLLTNLLSLDSLFRRDFEAGVIEQVMSSAAVPWVVIGLRIMAHWISTGLLVVFLSPLLCALLGVPMSAASAVALGLLLGTPAMSCLGAIGASLTVGISRGGALLALLILPLLLPVLIFGTGTVTAELAGQPNTGQLYWLGFISLLAMTMAPFAATAGLRISLQLQ